MPIFARYMSVTDYGIFSILRTLEEFLRVIFEMGASVSLARFFYECETQEDKVKLFSTLFFLIFGTALIVSFTFLLFGESLWNSLINDIPFSPYVILVTFTAIAAMPGILTRTLFRVHGQAKRFVILATLHTLLFVLLSVPSVVFFDMGALGPLISIFLATLIFFFIYMYYMREYIALKFSLKVLKQVLSFGLPEIPHKLANWGLRTISQLILQHYWSLSAVAMYAVAYSVASILFELIISAVHWAVEPFYYQVAKEESEKKAKEIFAYVATLNLTMILFFGLFANRFRKRNCCSIFASSKYADAEPIITILAMAAIFQFSFFIPGRGLYLKKKTFYLPILLFITLGINVIACFILIPTYGAIGTAWATFIAFFVRFVLTFALTQYIYFIPYNYSRIIKAVLAFAIVFFMVEWVPTDEPFYVTISWKLGALTLFPILLYLFRFFEDRELAKFRQILITRFFKKAR